MKLDIDIGLLIVMFHNKVAGIVKPSMDWADMVYFMQLGQIALYFKLYIHTFKSWMLPRTDSPMQVASF